MADEKNTYAPGGFLETEEGELIRIEAQVSTQNEIRFRYLKVYEEATDCFYFCKVLEEKTSGIEDLKNYRLNLVNMKRESFFKFSYPFIAHVHRSFVGKNAEGKPITAVMLQYVEGHNLEEYRSLLEERIQRGDLTFAEAQKLIFKQIYQFIMAMNYYLNFSTPPYLHRDIKPANIMINEKEEAILIDFDFAHNANSNATVFLEDGHIIGLTRGYASPAVYKFHKGDPDTFPTEQEDIYSAGRTLFFWLNNRHYFQYIAETGLNEKEIYPSTPKLGYGTELERFDKEYQKPEYQELVRILTKMCLPRKLAYQSIGEVKSDYEAFLMQFYKLTRRQFEEEFMPKSLLQAKRDPKAFESPGLSYIIGEDKGSRVGNKILDNAMWTISDHGRHLMEVYRRGSKIYYIPAIGSHVERLHEALGEPYEICNQDAFRVNGTLIQFTVQKRSAT